MCFKRKYLKCSGRDKYVRIQLGETPTQISYMLDLKIFIIKHSKNTQWITYVLEDKSQKIEEMALLQ